MAGQLSQQSVEHLTVFLWPAADIFLRCISIDASPELEAEFRRTVDAFFQSHEAHACWEAAGASGSDSSLTVVLVQPEQRLSLAAVLQALQTRQDLQGAATTNPIVSARVTLLCGL
jgi:hypothetical protein